MDAIFAVMGDLLEFLDLSAFTGSMYLFFMVTG